MRFFHQAARRAAVLLLCLSMLTGMLIPAFAATTDPATETPAHNPVYTDNQDENHDPIYKVRLTDDEMCIRDRQPRDSPSRAARSRFPSPCRPSLP